MYKEPVAWNRLLGKLSEVLGELMALQASAGAQVIQMFDSWVGCLSPDDYKRHVLPHSRTTLGAVPKNIPTIHFGTQTGEILELMQEAGGTVMGLDWRVDLDKAWSRLGHQTPIMGNLDPAILLGPQEEIHRQTQRILAQAAGRPGHIFNLGHGILPTTPVENVKYLVQCIKGGVH
jgi:uroporphyrinogen decarboxylase